MKLEIQWTASGAREARRLDPPIRRRLEATLERFAETGQGDLRQLKDSDPPQHRLRVGDWRVRLLVDRNARVLYVLSVLPRGKAYR